MSKIDIADIKLNPSKPKQTKYKKAKAAAVPSWLREPASIKPIDSIEDFTTRANAYFGKCVDADIRSTITGFCLAVGLPGPTSLIRLGQRIPELRFTISSCMTAIAHQYEQMIGFGNATGPMFMLKNIPDFDPEEAAGSPGVQFFNDRKEILLQATVAGIATTGEDYDADIDPMEVYMSIIKNPSSSISIKKDLTAVTETKTNQPHRLFRIIEEAS